MTAPALALTGIHKHFGSVHALRGADFTLMPGEVHALLGENGAGKTTLMHVAFGLVRPDAGTIRIEGRPGRPHSPREARRLGIGMVHQHFTSVPAFTVAENVALGAGWPVAPGALDARVRALCGRVGLPLDPAERADHLGVGLKQRLEIVKALAADTRILLLDEPTAVLAPDEVGEVLRVVRRFTAAGGSAVIITHRLDEALSGADRVTILRRGEVVGSGPVREWNPSSLTRAMIGDELPGGERRMPPLPATAAPPSILAEELEVAREGGHGSVLRRVTLTVREGEIVGLAAVEGNGHRELLRTIAGRLLPLSGRLDVAQPLGFIPEDRTTEGLIPELTVAENVVLASGPSDPWIVGRRVDWRAARARAAELLDQYDIVAAGPEAVVATLSGGNQQKLVLARELARAPRVVVAENPTRGLDLRAAAEIHRRLRDAARQGAAVLFHSSDLDEVLGLAHRVGVVSRGSVIDPGPAASRAEIGAMMLAGSR